MQLKSVPYCHQHTLFKVSNGSSTKQNFSMSTCDNHFKSLTLCTLS